jgi:hypothetical protein
LRSTLTSVERYAAFFVAVAVAPGDCSTYTAGACTGRHAVAAPRSRRVAAWSTESGFCVHGMHAQCAAAVAGARHCSPAAALHLCWVMAICCQIASHLHSYLWQQCGTCSNGEGAYTGTLSGLHAHCSSWS